MKVVSSLGFIVLMLFDCIIAEGSGDPEASVRSRQSAVRRYSRVKSQGTRDEKRDEGRGTRDKGRKIRPSTLDP